MVSLFCEEMVVVEQWLMVETVMQVCPGGRFDPGLVPVPHAVECLVLIQAARWVSR